MFEAGRSWAGGGLLWSSYLVVYLSFRFLAGAGALCHSRDPRQQRSGEQRRPGSWEKKDLACCRREAEERAEERCSEAACVTCSCRSRRWATFKIVRQVIWGLYRAASRGAPGRRTSGAKSKYSEIPPALV